MELKWLEDFVMLANMTSFSRAAEARHVTQSAFSRRIKQLETWLGTTLVSRASLPLDLTDEGRAFLPIAQEAIRTFYDLRETLPPEREIRHRRVTFAALHSLAITRLPEWLDRVRATLPDLLSVIQPDRGGIEANLEALISGEVDMFVSYAHPYVPTFLDPEEFEFQVMGREYLLPVSVPDLGAAAPPLLPGEGLIEQAIRLRRPLPYLDYGAGSLFGIVLQRVFAQTMALRRHVVHQSPISDGLRQCALAGWGVCWLPEGLVADDLRDGRLALASRDPAWHLPIELRVYRHRGDGRPVVGKLWDALKTMGEGVGVAGRGTAPLGGGLAAG